MDSEAGLKGSPTTRETIISNPNMPGVELVLPPGAVIRGPDGKIVTQVTLTPMPVDQTPFPMPFFDVPVYFTLQPGGSVIQGVDGKPKGALLRYPNYSAFGHLRHQGQSHAGVRPVESYHADDL